MRAIAALLLLISAMVACKPPIYTPKPPGYFRIDTPAVHQYQQFNEPGFPYSFEYPIYGQIRRDTIFLGKKAENPYWINISFPSFNAVINITYKEITPEQTLAKLNDDAWGLSFFHHEKSDYINEKVFANGAGVYGQFYIVGGNVASRYQFTATDSARNFMRGALYFDVTPNADSLKPANDFLEQDIHHLLMTLRFR